MSVSDLTERLRYVQMSGSRHVALLDDVWSDWDNLDRRWKAKFEHLFETYGDPTLRLTQEQFNGEGRHSSGGRSSKDVLVCAFKAFQQRLYGSIFDVDDIPTFVCAAYDQKKRNRADPKLLKAVAQKLGPYI